MQKLKNLTLHLKRLAIIVLIATGAASPVVLSGVVDVSTLIQMFEGVANEPR